MYPFRFIKTIVSGCLGSGAEGLALLQPQTNPLNDSFFRPGYAVRGGLAPTAPAQLKLVQQMALVDLVGNGLDIQGQFGLQRLSKLSNPNG